MKVGMNAKNAGQYYRQPQVYGAVGKTAAEKQTCRFNIDKRHGVKGVRVGCHVGQGS